MNRFLLSASALLFLAACSSMVSGSTQTVTFLTPGAQNARCYVDTDAVNGTRYRVHPPQTVRIKRGNDDLIVTCDAPGNRTKTMRVPRSLNGAAALNITNGIVPGVTYDHFSGALYDYPVEVRVDFGDMKAQMVDFPAHEAVDGIDPETVNVEDMGPKALETLRDYGRGAVPPPARIDDSFTEEAPVSVVPESAGKDGGAGRVPGTYLNN